MAKKLTLGKFVERAQKVHGNRYDYSKVKYINSYSKVCIICPQHGEFWQTPSSHFKGQGCNKCAQELKSKKMTLSTEEFIEKARKVHGDYYIYDNVQYKHNKEKIPIICPIHGSFLVKPNDHLNGCECPKCANEKRSKILSLTTSELKEKAKKKHNDKYDLSKIKYVDRFTKVCVTCPHHGEFWILPKLLINNKECCPICSKNHKYTTEEFIIKAKEVHGDRYDYSKTVYKNSEENITIICPIHGEYQQNPHSHLQGCGCPKCHESKLEKTFGEMLKSKGVEYVSQKRFEWLGKQSLDFYLPQYNIGIECQGKQHFLVNEYFGGEKTYQAQVERDERKRQLCEEHGIKLLYYSNLGIEYPYKVYENKEELLQKIAKKSQTT